MSQQHLVDLVEGHMVVQWEGEQGHLSSGARRPSPMDGKPDRSFLPYSFRHFGETYCLHLWGRGDSKSL